jgi:hypothetical protein
VMREDGLSVPANRPPSGARLQLEFESAEMLRLRVEERLSYREIGDKVFDNW